MAISILSRLIQRTRKWFEEFRRVLDYYESFSRAEWEHRGLQRARRESGHFDLQLYAEQPPQIDRRRDPPSGAATTAGKRRRSAA